MKADRMSLLSTCFDLGELRFHTETTESDGGPPRI
jgi:hypothetical protein